MSSTTISIVAALIVAGLAAVFVLTTSRRDKKLVDAYVADSTTSSSAGRDVEAAEKQQRLAKTETAVTEWTPPSEEAIGVSRRQFFNRGIVVMFGLGLAGFGVASLAFLWPNKVVGFGGKVDAGKLNDLLDKIKETKEPVYIPEGRLYIAPYPKDALPKAQQVSSYKPVLPGMEEGVVALYQKCVHLGCKVPWCSSSQWFECPCHGSRYNRVGEKKGGPAPRGLDRFVVAIKGENVEVDTGQRILGPPVGTNTTGQEAEGPHC